MVVLQEGAEGGMGGRTWQFGTFLGCLAVQSFRGWHLQNGVGPHGQTLALTGQGQGAGLGGLPPGPRLCSSSNGGVQVLHRTGLHCKFCTVLHCNVQPSIVLGWATCLLYAWFNPPAYRLELIVGGRRVHSQHASHRAAPSSW